MSVLYHDNLIQGTPEWKEFRLKFLTGTDAYKLIRGVTVEQIFLLKKAGDSFKGNRSTRRGHRLEPEAVELLEAIKGVEVHHTGFITNTKYAIAGYSPDGLIEEDGLVECKAFNMTRHLENSKRPEVTIIAQIQWGLFVSERKWAYLVLYNPDMEPEKAIFIIKVERNEKVMERFKSLIKGKK